MMPPCGVVDITNGTNWMCSSKKKHHHSRDSLHTVSHYTFFQGNPKWPSSKYHLAYGFLHGTPTEAMSLVVKAFETWAANTHFRFSRAQDHTNADIKVSFHKRDHGDGHAFDWAGGILAHAWHQRMGDFIMMQMSNGVLELLQVRLTWRLLHCMKLGTFLDLIIA